MKRNLSTKLTVECLEDRCVPATVRFTSGILQVLSLPGETVAINQSAINTFSVTSSTGTTAAFAGTSTILFTGAGGGETANVNLGGLTFSGQLVLNGQGGNDTLNVDNGTVTGNVFLLTGFGDDTVTLGSTAATDLSGNVQIVDSDKIGTLLMAAGGDVDLGSSTTNVNITQFGTIDQAGANSIVFDGNVLIQNSTLTTPSSITLDDPTLGAFVDVDGNMTIYTGSGNDTVSLGNNSVTDSLFVGGLLQITTGAGDDNVTIRGAFMGSINMLIDTGSGNDRVTLQASDDAAWSGSIKLGAGDDTFTLMDGVGTAAGSTWTGIVDGGTGVDTLVNANPAAGDWDDTGAIYNNF